MQSRGKKAGGDDLVIPAPSAEKLESIERATQAKFQAACRSKFVQGEFLEVGRAHLQRGDREKAAVFYAQAFAEDYGNPIAGESPKRERKPPESPDAAVLYAGSLSGLRDMGAPNVENQHTRLYRSLLENPDERLTRIRDFGVGFGISRREVENMLLNDTKINPDRIKLK